MACSSSSATTDGGTPLPRRSSNGVDGSEGVIPPSGSSMTVESNSNTKVCQSRDRFVDFDGCAPLLPPKTNVAQIVFQLHQGCPETVFRGRFTWALKF